MNENTTRTVKLVIFVAYLLAFACVAVYDQPLKPEAAKLLATFPRQIDLKDNLFCAYLGLNSPAGSDILAFGSKRVEAVRAFRESGKKGDPPADDLKDRLQFKGKLPTFYDKPGENIRRFLVKEPARADALLKDNGELVKRYLSLRTYKNFEEPLSLGIMLPLPQYSLGLEALRLEQIRLLRSGNIQETLQFVREDLAFWRQFAKHTKTLIGKLVASNAISRNYVFLGEFATATAGDRASWDMVDDLLRTIPYEELSLAASYPAEFYCIQDAISRGFDPRAGTVGRFIAPLFAKRNMTINKLYGDYSQYADLARLTAVDYARQYDAIRNRLKNDRKIGEPLLDWIINPGGESLARIAQPNVLSFAARPYRAEIIRRLVVLKLQIKRRNMADENIPAFLAQAGKELSDPFTGKPFSWDAKARKLFAKRIDSNGTYDVYME